MPAEIEPPELARLVDFAERPRGHDWSLRSALVRYAQPQPERVDAILELVRRIEAALHAQTKVLERDGRDLWDALVSADQTTEGDGLIHLLRATAELDRLGDALTEWAVDRAGERPDALVDDVTADVARRLDDLGVPREERQGPPRQRG